MSKLRRCQCGLTTAGAGAFARHTAVCDRPLTVETLVEYGRIDLPEDPNACWMWKRNKGYGKYSGDRAHRQMYRAYYGKEPGEKYVCHTCDTPGCVNPKHLWLGTPADNTRDAVNKGHVVSPMLDPEVVERVKNNLPRGDDHYIRRNPEVAELRVQQMLAGQKRSTSEDEKGGGA